MQKYNHTYYIGKHLEFELDIAYRIKEGLDAVEILGDNIFPIQVNVPNKYSDALIDNFSYLAIKRTFLSDMFLFSNTIISLDNPKQAYLLFAGLSLGEDDINPKVILPRKINRDVFA